MSISNFCVSESASSKFVEELEKRSIEKSTQLSHKLEGLTGPQLSDESKEMLFKLERYRIDQIEQFFRENPKQESKHSDDEEQSIQDDDSTAEIRQTEAQQQHLLPTVNQLSKKRGSMFQIGLNQENKVNFKRYSAANDGIGKTLQQLKFTALTPQNNQLSSALNSKVTDLREPDSESDNESDCSSESEEIQDEPREGHTWQPVIRIHSQNGISNATKCKTIDIVTTAKANKQKWKEMKGKSPVFVVPVDERSDCSVDITYSGSCSLKPKLESARSELLDTNAISFNSEPIAIDVVVEKNRFWCNEVKEVNKDVDSEFRNDVKLSINQKTKGQFTLRLESGFFGVFVNLPLETFNDQLVLRPGMMFFVSEKRGFLIKDIGNRNCLKDESAVIYWATNLKAESVGSLKSFLLQKAESPSCSSSCSSRVRFSLKQSLQSFLRSQVEETDAKVVVLTKFKFVARHKMFKFEESVCLFEVDLKIKELEHCFHQKSNELRFGFQTVKNLSESGFIGIHPLESLKMDFQLKIRLKDESAQLSYDKAESSNLIDLFDGESKKAILFGRSDEVSGLFVQNGLFQSGNELFAQSKEFVLSSGTAIRVCNTVYRIDC